MKRNIPLTIPLILSAVPSRPQTGFSYEKQIRYPTEFNHKRNVGNGRAFKVTTGQTFQWNGHILKALGLKDGQYLV